MRKDINDQRKKDCSSSPCSPEFVVEFGKHKGKTLEQIAEQENAYILWLDRENVLNIEQEFLEACKIDDFILRIVDGGFDIEDSGRWAAFRND